MNLLKLFQQDRALLLEDASADFRVESSPRDLQDLQTSLAWRDLRVAIEARILDLRDQLEFPHPEVVGNEEHEPPDSNHVRGQLYAYRAILGLPEALRQEILQRRKENEERQNG